MFHRSIVAMVVSILVASLPVVCLAKKEKKAKQEQVGSVVDRLIKTIQYGEERDKEDAIIALGMIGDKSAVAPLCECFEHTKDRKIRRAIIRALGRLRSPEATPILIQVLETDDYEFARVEAAWALGEIGGNDALAALEAALKDKSIHVRRRSAEILEEITGEKYEYEGKIPKPSFEKYYQRLEELKAGREKGEVTGEEKAD